MIFLKNSKKKRLVFTLTCQNFLPSLHPKQPNRKIMEDRESCYFPDFTQRPRIIKIFEKYNKDKQWKIGEYEFKTGIFPLKWLKRDLPCPVCPFNSKIDKERVFHSKNNKYFLRIMEDIIVIRCQKFDDELIIYHQGKGKKLATHYRDLTKKQKKIYFSDDDDEENESDDDDSDEEEEILKEEIPTFILRHREELDLFLDSWISEKKDAKIKSSQFAKFYYRWRNNHNMRPLIDAYKLIKRDLESSGYEYKRYKDGNYIMNIKLKGTK